ncbi:MAG: NAD(P)-binding domain-containing protein [Saprospiraceae bacterium]|nr:NAD(P)-binding domain-containing protein [Saprospiraceae bacterium]
MKIAIIGHGNVGGALAGQWLKAGHEIIVGARNPRSEKLERLLSKHPDITIMGVAKAAQTAEVLLIATPPEIATHLVEQWGNVNGKTIIDATNAVRKKPDPYPSAYHAFAALTEAEVVKCFNTTGFENMANPKYGNLSLDLFMAGDSDSAKAIARQLALDAGFADCYDFGKADRVELLEQFALAWINLALFQGHGRRIGFKLLKR